MRFAVNSKIPKHIRLLVCPVCGRTDRYSDLKEGSGRHKTAAGKCLGEPTYYTYQLVEL